MGSSRVRRRVGVFFSHESDICGDVPRSLRNSYKNQNDGDIFECFLNAWDTAGINNQEQEGKIPNRTKIIFSI